MTPDRDGSSRSVANDVDGRSEPAAVWWARPRVVVVCVTLLLTVCVAVQVVRDARYGAERFRASVLYIPSGSALQRLALSFDALLADVYWIRAVIHYGSVKLAEEEAKDYSLLHPLLDITTTLDPRFDAAYRFGAIFLTEAFPDGPGRPDLAVALLQKGVRSMPERWRYLQDIGFVYYWWLHDYDEAAAWFQRASEVPGSSWWLQPLAANTLTEGGNRSASRMLWRQMHETADNEWIRDEALRRLAQLDALDQIEIYTKLVDAFETRNGRLPESWEALVADGALTRVPLDPTGLPYLLLQRTGEVTVSSQSALFPLPDDPRPQAPLPQ